MRLSTLSGIVSFRDPFLLSNCSLCLHGSYNAPFSGMKIASWSDSHLASLSQFVLRNSENFAWLPCYFQFHYLPRTDLSFYYLHILKLAFRVQCNHHHRCCNMEVVHYSVTSSLILGLILLNRSWVFYLFAHSIHLMGLDDFVCVNVSYCRGKDFKDANSWLSIP